MEIFSLKTLSKMPVSEGSGCRTPGPNRENVIKSKILHIQPAHKIEKKLVHPQLWIIPAPTLECDNVDAMLINSADKAPLLGDLSRRTH